MRRRGGQETTVTTGMRKICGAAAIAMAAGSAAAADFPPYPAPGPIGGYAWTGPYIGGNLGYQWASTTHNPTRPWGIAGGLQGGYNWQTGAFVFGGEADLTLSSASDTFAPWKFSNRWFGTLRGRAGYGFNNILVYATLGFAFGGGRVDVGGASEGKTHLGWAAGGGMEVGLTSAWSARVEYLFVDLSDRPYGLTGVGNGFESSVLRLGVNYRF
jgi:outer membrane immunogenic protein